MPYFALMRRNGLTSRFPRLSNTSVQSFILISVVNFQKGRDYYKWVAFIIFIFTLNQFFPQSVLKFHLDSTMKSENKSISFTSHGKGMRQLY